MVDRSWLVSRPGEDDCFAHVIKFLDPGLDFPSCRLVHPAWNEWVVSSIDNEKEANVWMSRLQIDGKDGYSDRLRRDFAMVRETTDEEREQYIQATMEELEDEYGLNHHFQIESHHLWRRTDVVPTREGRCRMMDWDDRRRRPLHCVGASRVEYSQCPHVGR